jgi:alkylhydroperoxidase family enzyme
MHEAAGCAALAAHAKDARAAGETEQRLHLLNAWREAADLYSDRERAALVWTEAITTIAEGHASEEAYQETRAQFADAELVRLTLATISINAWNRLNIASRIPSGNYRSSGGCN